VQNKHFFLRRGDAAFSPVNIDIGGAGGGGAKRQSLGTQGTPPFFQPLCVTGPEALGSPGEPRALRPRVGPGPRSPLRGGMSCTHRRRLVGDRRRVERREASR
jgi:hypothetical protein